MTVVVAFHDNGKKGRGRPPGVKNGEGKKEKWNPKKLTSKHISILSMCLMNVPRDFIADKYGVSVGLINQIYNSPKGQEYVALMTRQLEERIRETVLEKTEVSANRAIENIHTVLHDEAAIASKPIEMGNFSMKYLQGVGKMKSDEGSGNRTNILNIIGADAFKEMSDVLKSSTAAIEANNGLVGVEVGTTGDMRKLKDARSYEEGKEED